MLLSHRHRFIFIHIPKCAGTSVAQSLRPLSDWPHRILGYNLLFERYQSRFEHLNKHMRAYRVRRIVGEKTWEAYFKFSFVRNPFSRTVSYYTWVARMVGKDRESSGANAYIRSNKALYSFPITQAYLETDTFSEFIRHPGFLSDHGCQPQVDFVNHPKTGKVEIDYVGKVETLAKDLHYIGKKLKNKKLTIYAANVSQRRKSVPEYFKNEDDINHIRNIYARDFDQLGYADTLDALFST